MIGHWLQWTASGVTAVLAAFWIRSASISPPAMELVGDPIATTKEVPPIEPPPAISATSAADAPESGRVKSSEAPKKKIICAAHRRSSGSEAAKPKPRECAAKHSRQRNLHRPVIGYGPDGLPR